MDPIVSVTVTSTTNKKSNLYTFSSQLLSDIQKFRFSSGRATTLQAQIYSIDKSSYDIIQESSTVITDIDDLKDQLPSNSPRYVLLSYPHKTTDGRLVSPLVLVYWKPPTSQESKMLYAGALQLFRDKAGVSKLIDFDDEDDFDNLDDEFN